MAKLHKLTDPATGLTARNDGEALWQVCYNEFI
jgi:hypothetical protein